jgi:two-component system response regulator HydG
MKRLFLVEDKRGMRAMLTAALEEEGWQVTSFTDGAEAVSAASAGYDAVLCDVCLPGADGLAILAAFGRLSPSTPVILMTAFGSVDLAVRAMKLGARDFVTKPFELDRLLGMLDSCLPGSSDVMEGRSPVFLKALERAAAAARGGLNVLVLGESGTGKELLARRIHRQSGRREGPFVPVNCAAIPSELVESELFGAEKGAYTGADSRRQGRFELASGGTIFLDEVGDLAPALQGKLLRVLQDREYTRVGGGETLRADVRVISASNRDLSSESKSGRFRNDLYFRLAEFPITLPPLREREGDLELLAGHFLTAAGRTLADLPPGSTNSMSGYSWPGNVRELRSILLRACALAEGREIRPGDLEIPAGDAGGMLDAASRAARETERRLLTRTLEDCGGNRSEAARRLGVSRRTLLNRIRDLGMD